MSLKIFIGPMFAGKTTALIKHYKQQKEITKIIVDYDIKLEENNEINIGEMITHTELKYSSVYKTKKLNNLYDINNYNFFSKDVQEYHYEMFFNATDIYINECQFFPDLKRFVLACLKNDINVHLYGLDGDYKQEKFGEILDLIPYCSSLSKIKGKCAKCKNKSVVSHRTTNEKKQYLTDAFCYQPLCLKCYLE